MSIYSGMSMGDRILMVRKDCGGLSQEEFAERLGLTKSAISGYETGRRVPTDSVLKHIACEFRVDEDWLKDGSGYPFDPTENDVMEEMFRQFNCSEFERAFLRSYLCLPESDRLEFSRYLERLFLGTADELGIRKKSEMENQPSRSTHEMSREEIHAELDRQMNEEKEAEGDVPGYGHGNSEKAIG